MSKYAGAWAAVVWLCAACVHAPEEPPPPRVEDERPPAEPERPPEEPARPGMVRVGVVLSTSGSAVLQQYGEQVLDGLRVGADAASSGGGGLDLVIRDDGGTAAGAARAVRELEREGVRVIVGPLVEEALAAAAAARESSNVTLISPMAVSDPGAANVYAMNVLDTRGAAALGEYARRYDRVGLLYASTPDASRQAQAFADAYAAGGNTPVQAPFPIRAANVANELERLREAGVQAIYFPAGARELQVVLPQIAYAGMGAVQLFGNEAWVADLRALPPQAEGAIVATPLVRDSDELAWLDFVGLYEARYRRSLDNPVPALGYDAARLAARLAAGDDDIAAFRGATGVITLRDDTITRRPFLVRIQAGRLIPVN